MKKITALLILMFFNLTVGQEKPVFKSLRYDDDFTYLKNDSVRSWYEQLKFTPLNQDQESYLSVGGDLRYQYFNVKNEDWGDTPADKDGYILTRYLAHLDFHISKNFRFFFQLQSSISSSRENPSPVDENTLDVHQVFIDGTIFKTSNSQLLFRAGRQEMLYGSQRLVAVREFPNNRMAFDGAKLMFSKNNIKSDVFYTHPIANKMKIFDDSFNEDAKLWGSYTTLKNIGFLNNIDLYYLGLWKRNATFDAISGKELRHSVGTRVWKNKGNWQYDFEAVYQFGELEYSDISAWTVSSNTTYQFQNVKYDPKLGLKTELISGDKNAGDGKLETFNPLYPRGAYFGLAGLIGPSNLFDIHPSVELEFTSELDFGIDYDLFWRLSNSDGIYAPNMQLIYSGENSSEKFIGKQLAANLSYQPNPYLHLKIEGTWFDSGAFLKDSGTGKDVFFAAITTQLKF